MKGNGVKGVGGGRRARAGIAGHETRVRANDMTIVSTENLFGKTSGGDENEEFAERACAANYVMSIMGGQVVRDFPGSIDSMNRY